MKRLMQGLLKNRKGSALLLTILAVGILAVLGLTLASLTMADNLATVHSLGEVKARYAAEAGVNRALYEIRNYLETGISPASSYQDSLEPDLNYNVSLDRIPNSDLFQINARGTYENFSGEIKAKADTLPKAADYAIFTDQDLNYAGIGRVNIKGNIHSNGKIRAVNVASFNLEGEAEAVNAESSIINGYPVQKAERISFPQLDWARIKSRANLINQPTLNLSILGVTLLNLWVVPVLNGQTAYFTDDILVVGPFVGRGVIAGEGNIYVLLSGETVTPRPDEGIMLAAKKDIVFLASITDLGNLLRGLAGILGDLPLLGNLIEGLLKSVLKLVGISENPDIYLNGLVYANEEIRGVLNLLTVKGTVIARSLGNLDLTLDVEHDPDLAGKLPAQKIFFENNPVRIVSWEES